jgi:hypothetical protein
MKRGAGGATGGPYAAVGDANMEDADQQHSNVNGTDLDSSGLEVRICAGVHQRHAGGTSACTSA